MRSQLSRLFLAVTVLSASAFAVPVSITNWDFDCQSETVSASCSGVVGPDLTTGNANGTVAGWITEGAAVGTYNPGVGSTVPVSSPYIAYLNNDAGLAQILGTTAEANTMYTFSVQVAGRPDFDGNIPMAYYRLELYSGTTLLACSQNFADGGSCSVDNTELPNPGVWQTASLQYTTDAVFTGGALGIRIASFVRPDMPGFTSQLNVDDVKLDAAAANGAIPEPMTIALMGSGLVGLALLRRRQKTSK